MKAKLVDGKIIWGDKSNESDKEFLDVVFPEIDSEIEYPDKMYLDKENEVYTFEVIQKTQKQLEKEQENKLVVFEDNVDMDVIKSKLLRKIKTGEIDQDLGAMISIITTGVQQLIDQNAQLTTRLEKVEKSNKLKS